MGVVDSGEEHGEGVHPPTARRPSAAGRKLSWSLPTLEDFQATISKGIAQYTQDALPREENYRNLDSFLHKGEQRPTIDDLQDEDGFQPRRRVMGGNVSAVDNSNGVVKFGWVRGVFIRCILNIWGVMLFLRLSWMVAESGIVWAVIIIVMSSIVTGITTLSMSAVSTNGEIKGGGLYYMISRSLGPEWGGSIGTLFSFANAGMAALNIVGFSEAMIALLDLYGIKILDGAANDNRIISCITVLILQAIIIIGMEWEAKAQLVLLAILLASMADFCVGFVMGPRHQDSFAKGWVGFNTTVIKQNMWPAYRDTEGMHQSLFTVFSVFFPAVSGIQAGASISGDLKNPGEAIPKGTLWAIFVTSSSYALFGIMAGMGCVREASGVVSEVANWHFTDCHNRTCAWGLYNDYNIMTIMAYYGPLIFFGCFAACLSSALSCMVSGPKTFQAVCQDKIYPYISRFGQGFGKTDEPYWSHVLSFSIAVCFILIGNLDQIAALMSNLFMLTYAILNFCVFNASISHTVGWRPDFKYYNKWVSLVGALLCFGVMVLMSWVMTIISCAVVIPLYGIVVYRKPALNWGTSRQAMAYNDALDALYTLTAQEEHVKNYRPQILCLSGHPTSRPALVDLANLLTKGRSLLICSQICQSQVKPSVRKATIQNGYDALNANGIKSFYVVIDNCSFDEGSQSLLQSTGVGKMAPNVVLMGFKSDWQTCSRQEIMNYFQTINIAFHNNMGIAILRVKNRLDYSELEKPNPESKTSGGYVNSGLEIDARNDPQGVTVNVPHSHVPHLTLDKSGKNNEQGGIELPPDNLASRNYCLSDGSELPTDMQKEILTFRHLPSKSGFVDVWWLYDDGGLTLLLPYILTLRKTWNTCKLRVFTLCENAGKIEDEMIGMAALLAKFRIDYSNLTIIPDITKKAEEGGKVLFESLIKKFRKPSGDDEEEFVVTDEELSDNKERTNRHLRLRELLTQHSKMSNLIVVTLPVPRRGAVSAPIYLAWLEVITRDMPPILLVRGNQSNVLTFYS